MTKFLSTATNASTFQSKKPSTLLAVASFTSSTTTCVTWSWNCSTSKSWTWKIQRKQPRRSGSLSPKEFTWTPVSYVRCVSWWNCAASTSCDCSSTSLFHSAQLVRTDVASPNFLELKSRKLIWFRQVSKDLSSRLVAFALARTLLPNINDCQVSVIVFLRRNRHFLHKPQFLLSTSSRKTQKSSLNSTRFARKSTRSSGN